MTGPRGFERAYGGHQRGRFRALFGLPRRLAERGVVRGARRSQQRVARFGDDGVDAAPVGGLAWLGGLVLGAGFGPTSPSGGGAALAVGALALAVLAARLERRGRPRAGAPGTVVRSRAWPFSRGQATTPDPVPASTSSTSTAP